MSGATADGVRKDEVNSGVSLNLGPGGVLTLLPLVYICKDFFSSYFYSALLEFSGLSLHGNHCHNLYHVLDGFSTL